MSGAAASPERSNEAGEALVPGERTVFDRPVDARQLLQHDPPGADIHVANLGIAHLTLGQPDKEFARLQQGMWAGRQEAMPVWRLRQLDTVVGAIGAMAPAVEDAKHGGAGGGGGARGLPGTRVRTKNQA